ncbi:MAG: hypothetical protein AAGA60_10790 [Cyanobacteria bacterium P01_E01_bin.42]
MTTINDKRNEIALTFFDSFLCARLNDGDTNGDIEDNTILLRKELRLSFLLADEFMTASQEFPKGFASETSIFKEDAEPSPT